MGADVMTREPYRHRRAARRQRRVLLVLLTGASNLGGYTVCQAAQVGPGTFYPMMDRLERTGWVTGRWEAVPAGEDRPRRRFYSLTLKGQMRARQMLGLRWDTP
jgi:DNA-binding MarR family transcriptional regulator